MRFLLIHPNADPAEITREIGLVPRRSWRYGEPRSTPKGIRLEGVWRDTRWSCGFDLVEGSTIEEAIANAIERLAPARRFLTSLRETGGTAELIVNLPGDTHRGASIGMDLLSALADLGVSLGIEVFPEMNG